METDISAMKQKGFSLVELSVVLSIVGIVLSMGYMIFPKQIEMDMRQKSQIQVQKLEYELVGFALQNHRLPCPDKNGDGLEQCAGAVIGEFPWRTVGLTSKPIGSSKVALRYGVYKNAAANLTLASNIYSPLLPLTNIAGVTVSALNNINGFDFCRNIRNASVTTFSAADLNVAGQPIAYALLDAGSRDADGDGSLWDGVNANMVGATVDSPNRIVDQSYDDAVFVMPLYQLLGDMGCGALGQLHAAGVASVAAKDTYDLWNLMVAARTTDKGNAASGVSSAQTGVSFATFDVAMGAASLALSIASAADSFGIGAVSIPVAAGGLASAIVALVQANTALVQANASLSAANVAMLATIAKKTAAATYANNTIAAVVAMDLAGIAR